MKAHPILFSGPMVRALLAERKFVTRRLSRQWLKVKAGDRLWVRENFLFPGSFDSIRPGIVRHGTPIWFEADGAANAPCTEWGKLRPSFFLPRWASRILLECEEDARLERLQDITDEDAISEGIEPISSGAHLWHNYLAIAERACDWYTDPINSFRSLWQSLHTKPGERFSDNPEVVRVGRFRVVDRKNGGN